MKIQTRNAQITSVMNENGNGVLLSQEEEP